MVDDGSDRRAPRPSPGPRARVVVERAAAAAAGSASRGPVTRRGRGPRRAPPVPRRRHLAGARWRRPPGRRPRTLASGRAAVRAAVPRGRAALRAALRGRATWCRCWRAGWPRSGPAPVRWRSARASSSGADVLAAVGGFDDRAREVVEDAALARAFRGAGRPVHCLGGGDDGGFRMYPDGTQRSSWTGGRRTSPAARRRVRAWPPCSARSLWVTAGLSVVLAAATEPTATVAVAWTAIGDAALVDAAPPRLVPLAHRRPVPHPAARLRRPVRLVAAARVCAGRSGDVARAPRSATARP